MNVKKLSLAALSLTLAAGLLAGCAGSPTATPSATPSTTPSVTPSVTPSATPSDTTAVKTGLSISASVADSKDASADKDGVAKSEMTLVAVTVDDNGVIDSCVIDIFESKISFDATGKLTTDPATQFPTKNELGDEYGMKKASPIGKEWNEQAAALAEYAVGKTVDELMGLPVNEKGAPTDADLVSSVTISVGGYLAGIQEAVNNATHLGAQKGDKLALTSDANMKKSKDATAEKDGLAQAYTYFAAVTLQGDTVTSCYIDSVQANVNFNASGVITSDLTAAVPSKNQLGDEYGMKKASAIGKEWNEQAAAFSAYATGKTVSEITGMALNDKGGPADPDVASSVTIGISSLQTLIAKAAG